MMHPYLAKAKPIVDGEGRQMLQIRQSLAHQEDFTEWMIGRSQITHRKYLFLPQIVSEQEVDMCGQRIVAVVPIQIYHSSTTTSTRFVLTVRLRCEGTFAGSSTKLRFGICSILVLRQQTTSNVWGWKWEYWHLPTCWSTVKGMSATSTGFHGLESIRSPLIKHPRSAILLQKSCKAAISSTCTKLTVSVSGSSCCSSYSWMTWALYIVDPQVSIFRNSLNWRRRFWRSRSILASWSKWWWRW